MHCYAWLFLPLPQFEQFLVPSTLLALLKKVHSVHCYAWLLLPVTHFLVPSTVLPPLKKVHSVHCCAWILLPLPQFEQFLVHSTVLSPLEGTLSALLYMDTPPTATV